jgi:hypothetical protein
MSATSSGGADAASALENLLAGYIVEKVFL